MQPIQIECFTTWAASTTVGPDLFTRGSAIGTASLLKQNSDISIRRSLFGSHAQDGKRKTWPAGCALPLNELLLQCYCKTERRLGTRQVLGLFHTKMAKSSFAKKDYNFSRFWIGKAPTSWYPRNQVSETVHNSQSKTKQVNFRVKIERYLTRPREQAFILPRPSGMLYEWLWACE